MNFIVYYNIDNNNFVLRGMGYKKYLNSFISTGYLPDKQKQILFF